VDKDAVDRSSKDNRTVDGGNRRKAIGLLVAGLARSVHITAQDGASWDVRFAPRTLRPDNPVDQCTKAPDFAGD